MSVAALVVWIVTASGGLVMLGIWIKHGGLRHQHEGGTRFPVKLIFGHFGLAAAGLLTWIAFVATDNAALAWVGAGLLVPVAALGFTMLAKWLGCRASARADSQPEQRFPKLIVVAHGVAAVTTVVLVVVAAIQAS